MPPTPPPPLHELHGSPRYTAPYSSSMAGMGVRYSPARLGPAAAPLGSPPDQTSPPPEATAPESDGNCWAPAARTVITAASATRRRPIAAPETSFVRMRLLFLGHVRREET